MDEYKEYLYKKRPDYRTADTGSVVNKFAYLAVTLHYYEIGDLSKQKALRERLKCSPFKWFMESVAFDQPLNYPAIEPEDYARGDIRNVQFGDYCVYPINDKNKFVLQIILPLMPSLITLAQSQE